MPFQNFETPLSTAVENNNGEIVRLLLENGADPLGKCSSHGLDWNDSVEGSEETSALFLACTKGRLAAARELCKCMRHFQEAAGRDANERGRYDVDRQQSGNKVTALMCAAYGGHLEVVQELCCTGRANVTIADRLGRTAAHFASMRGHWEIVVELCGKHGAACSVKDQQGQSVADVAINGETGSAAKMCLLGESAYSEALLVVNQEADKKLILMQEKLDRALASMEEARRVVASVEAEERGGATASVSVSVTFSRLASLLSEESSLESAKLKDLTELKKRLRRCMEKVEVEMEKRLDAHSTLTTCLICNDNQRDCVLMPCRHMACCGDCTRHVNFRSCPLCLGRVEKIVADVTVRGPVASEVGRDRIGSMEDEGGGNYSQRDVEGGENVPYAPVIVLRQSNDVLEALERAASPARARGATERSSAGRTEEAQEVAVEVVNRGGRRGRRSPVVEAEDVDDGIATAQVEAVTGTVVVLPQT